ncbi:gliding motility-associated C-terminal domain-containing protein [Aquimarina sp. ERC-38]|uniref:T9SS type B sorting domain-containing protein n=1 Tax=Aquimarina sp. ERC-38 TaxID=2949996 RepID=UPI0022470F0A|nr:gliding motility-associated C-terminal domain-containing protein [Aquimarina sp. ERC-38]UZO80275.1 gliding motility-associated C-terminal domain-containing protein [Aquimarina sp. ERC-38]
MQTIDGDSTPGPDGIINLYTELGIPSGTGTWQARPRYAGTLDQSTGNVRTWEFLNATTNITREEYRFELFTAACGNTPAIVADLILGPYAGEAAPPQANGANAEICETDRLDLFETLTQNEFIPAPHLNGRWEYIGSSSGANFKGSFDLNGSTFSAVVPKNDDDRSTDNEIFELRYTVSNTTDCTANSKGETIVKVSVVRQVDPGTGNLIEICEEDITAGNWDTDINLNDDAYLVGEDKEGYWLSELDLTGQLENEQDSIINIREIYDDLIANRGARFGCASYSFTYFVPQRSAVCTERRASVSFQIFEELRPFEQSPGIPELCINQIPSTYDLYNLIDFEDDGTNNFSYNDDNYVSWRQVSGPADLGILTQPNSLSDFIPDYDYHLGTINLNAGVPGSYTFEYAVAPKINCTGANEILDPFVTDSLDLTFDLTPCSVLSTLITIELLPFDYAGENTEDLIFCNTDTSINLVSLLDTNGRDTIVPGGVWRDSIGNPIQNEFVFPVIDSVQRFNFTYTTTTAKSCTDSANLKFAVYKQANAGDGTDITLCSDDLNVTLFDLLTQTPDTIGRWTGPFGYESEDHRGVFDANNTMLPVLGQGTYTYLIEGNEGCPDSDQATVNVTIIDPVPIGEDIFVSYCILDGRVNLYDVLDRQTTRTGVFRDIENTAALSADGVVTFEQLPNPNNEVNKIYNFQYVVPNLAPCDESTLNVEVTIIDLPEPVVPNPQFCILDAKRLDDIEVDVDNFNWYATLESDTPITDNPILLDNDVYYIANVDVDNCESDRVTVTVDILNTGERFANGDICTLEFQDGVSPDNNNQNDTFSLFVEEEFNIPEAFPDFNLQIFNRYGTLVYEADKNTEEFRGESNTSVRLGDDLPSGTYFYIFNPNFDNNLPMQGSFYLAR